MKKKEYKKRMEKEKQAMRDFQENDTTKNIKNGIIITAVVLVFLLLMFVFTKVKTGEWNLFTRKNNINYAAEAQTTKILCGQVLNRSEDEYFVLAYEMDEDTSSLYDSIIQRYNEVTDKLSLHTLDLSNSRNGSCKADKINVSNNIKELKLSVPSLIRVKGSKVVASYTDYDAIKNTLYSYVD